VREKLPRGNFQQKCAFKGRHSGLKVARLATFGFQGLFA
jgi:hypothetical protein